jgi:drug/metabolite transporter (DMT)-like permease
MSVSPNGLKGAVWAALATVCWGSAIVMSKGALQVLPSGSLLVMQLVASTVFVWAVLLCRRTRRLPWRTSVKIGVLGWLEPGLAYFFSLAGLASTRAGVASLIQATEAFMIIGLASVLLRQRLRSSAVLLGIMALVGVVIAGDIGLGGGDHQSVGGIALVLLGTFCAALYVTLSSRIVGEYDPLYMIGMQQLFALALALVLACNEPHVAILRALSTKTFALIVTSGILQYSLAFWFYLVAMRHMSAKAAGMFLNLIPILALIEAYLVLGETLRLGQWIGVLVVLGAILVFTLVDEGDHGGGGAHT